MVSQSVYGKFAEICKVFMALNCYCRVVYSLSFCMCATVHYIANLPYPVCLCLQTHKAHLDKLIQLNNKLLRIIQNKPRKTHLIELYENYSTLRILLLHQ